ncbi:hypothetical protein RRG08_021769 [Elysia crispata]|uniref:Ig-like domain-containing protein n=1 Tax=Elysia crispata TaxID=231223 RepID=A0AAE1DQ49_9GAST|nr:hypothetical protein RRG08_021769 [Elysia crispata]
MTLQKRSWFVFLAFLALLLATIETEAAQRGPNSNICQRLDRIEDKIEEMDSKLDMLTLRQGEHAALTRMDRKLDLLLRERQTGNLDRTSGQPGQPGQESEHSGQTNQPGQTEQGEQETLPYAGTADINGIQILKIEKTPVSQGNRYVINFKKDGHCFFEVFSVNKPPIVLSVEEGPDGEWTSTFTVESDQDDHVWFMMTCRDEKDIIVSLRLKNSIPGPVTVENLYLPTIDGSPPGPVTFEPGEDLNFTATSPADPTTGQVVEFIRARFSGIDLETGKFHMHMSTEEIIRELSEVVTLQGATKSLTLLTSTKPVSGRLSLEVESPLDDNALVREITVTEEIPIKPAGQVGEVPPQYLTIVEMPHREKSKNGNELETCSVGQECPIYCLAIGDRITSMFVYKVFPNGTQEPVYSRHELPSSLPTTKGIYWMFHAEEDSGDTDGITTFRCLAYDTFHFEYTAKLMDVLARIDPSIDSERSGLTVEDDPADPSSKTITLQCAVRGRPLPDVRFTWDVSSTARMYQNPPDNVTSSSKSEALATKTFVLNANELATWNDEDEESPICSFYSSTLGEYVMHHFERPYIS